MKSRNLFVPILMAWSLTVGLGEVIPMANAASAAHNFPKLGQSTTNDVVEVKSSKGRPLPIAPSYLAYDWPYYFRRGHYPTHIGPGYVYYDYPYTYRTSRYPRYGGQCSYWPATSLRRAWVDARRCIGN